MTVVVSTSNLDMARSIGSDDVIDYSQEDLEYLGELLEAGKILPVIDGSYPLGEIDAAFRYIEDKHAQGKVVITVESENQN